jgi:hypothetical protein
MKLDKMFPSKYVSGKEMERPVVATISGVTTTMLRPNRSQPEVPGFLLKLKGWSRDVVLSKPLAISIAEALGSDDTDHWVGAKIVLYSTQMTVAGQLRIAIRAKSYEPKQEASPPTPPIPTETEPASEEVAEQNAEEPAVEEKEEADNVPASTEDPRKAVILEGIGVPMAGKTLGEVEENNKGLFKAIVDFLSGSKANAAGDLFTPQTEEQRLLANAAKAILEK